MPYDTIGAQHLAEKFGGPLGVAEALLEGRLDSYDEQWVSQVVSMVILEAAKFRIQNKLNSKAPSRIRPKKGK